MNPTHAPGYVLCLLALALAACAPDPCRRVSPCLADPTPTAAAITTCENQLATLSAEPCYGDFVAVANCLAANVACGSNGQTDTATSATRGQAACASQITSARQCCGSNPRSAACM